MKETGAQGVKVESGPTVPETIDYLVQRGIPVMGHVGLRPQAVLNDGGFKAKGKTEDERIRVMSEAEATADAGAFAVVIEGVAEGLAREITLAIDMPTIGIGASAACDGQILGQRHAGPVRLDAEVRAPLRRSARRNHASGEKLRRRCQGAPFSRPSRDLLLQKAGLNPVRPRCGRRAKPLGSRRNCQRPCFMYGPHSQRVRGACL